MRRRRLVVPSRLGRRAARSRRTTTGPVARRRTADHGQIGAAPGRLPRGSCRRGSIYIKHFLIPDWRAMLRQWVRRGKGRNEGKRSQHLASIGVPTITPIALGERRKRKFLFENYLVTLAISAATPLDEFVEHQLPEWPDPLRSHTPAEARRSPGRHDGPAARCRPAPPGLSSRQHLGSLRRPSIDRNSSMIDLDALRKCRRVTWKLATPQPGSARSLLLAAQHSDRPLSFLEDLPGEPVGTAARGPSVRPSDRGHDPALGRAALAALGAPLPVVEQVLQGLSR